MKRWWRAMAWPLVLAALSLSVQSPVGLEGPPTLSFGLERTHFPQRSYAFLLLVFALACAAGWRVVRRGAGGRMAASVAGVAVAVMAFSLSRLAVATFRLATGTLVADSLQPFGADLQLEVYRDNCEMSLHEAAIGGPIGALFGLLGGSIAGRVARRVGTGQLGPSMGREGMRRQGIALWWLLVLAALARLAFPPVWVREADLRSLPGGMQVYDRALASPWAFALVIALALLAGWRVVWSGAGGRPAAALAGALVGFVTHLLAPLVAATAALLLGVLVPESISQAFPEAPLEVFRDNCEACFSNLVLLPAYALVGFLGGWLAARSRRPAAA